MVEANSIYSSSLHSCLYDCSKQAGSISERRIGKFLDIEALTSRGPVVQNDHVERKGSVIKR